jgi:ubiquinone/menaquinone biosynthesis C-methylase UbiE
VTDRPATHEGHADALRREFAKQSASFENPRYSFANPRLQAWALEHIPHRADDVVLDVAAGTGLLGRALAPHVRVVVAVDLTPEMLRTGSDAARRDGVRNVVFEVGDAAALPHLDGSFDLVVSRFAVHHFEAPARELAEMARVCRPGREVAIVDLVAADAALADRYNELERMRDPTHVRALTHDELAAALEAAGLMVERTDSLEQVVEVERWFDQAQTRAGAAEEIRAALRAELAGGAPTGMRPVDRDGRLRFTQRYEVAVARRAGDPA